MVEPIAEFKVIPASCNDYFVPDTASLTIDVVILRNRAELNEWTRENTVKGEDAADDDEDWDYFFVEVGAIEEKPTVFGLLLLHLGTFRTSQIVYASTIAATRFLDRVIEDGYISCDRNVLAETTSTIARQIADELWERELIVTTEAA